MKKKGISSILFAVLIILSVMTIVIGSADNSDGNGVYQTTNEEQLTLDSVNTVKEKTPNIAQRDTKIERGLSDKIKKIKANEKAIVAIWVESDDIQGITRPETAGDGEVLALTGEQVAKDIESQSNKIKAAISGKKKPVIDHLKSKNINILYDSEYAPVLFAELSANEVKGLEARSDVVALDLSRDYYDYNIDTSTPTVLAPPVWPYVVSGTKVAVVEPDGIAFANPYLKDGIYFNSVTKNIQSHATAVAGIIASTHATYQGVVWKGPALLSANSQSFSDSALMAASDWAINKGARVLSNSWGSTCPYNNLPLTAIAKYFDWLVYYYGVTVVFSSGNCGTWPYPYNVVSDPGSAFNVITVGSFHDRNTGWMWWDDKMSSFSSYRNPLSRDKPEVVAAGGENTSLDSTGSIRSTTISTPWTGTVGWGTSYAAPQVAGEASLLINKTASLYYWPEIVKAIIMASADHNLEGSSRLSDQDGVGGINVQEAYKIAVSPTRIAGVGITYGTRAPWFSPNFSASMGQNVRTVITWDSNITARYGGSDTLNADLDLYIQRWTGTAWLNESRAGYSTSGPNNFEIVDFNAPASGIYRAMVWKYSWTNKARTEWLGYATYVK